MKVKNHVEFGNVSRYLEKFLAVVVVWCFVSGAGVHPVLTAGVFTLPAGVARDLTGKQLTCIWRLLVENIMFMLSYYRTVLPPWKMKKTRYILGYFGFRCGDHLYFGHWFRLKTTLCGQLLFETPDVVPASYVVNVTLQELCQVIQQPDVKVLKNYIKVRLCLYHQWDW